MALVVLDTDVTSRIIKNKLPVSLATKLVGYQFSVTFVTVGELRRWGVERELSARRRAEIERWITPASIGAGFEVAQTWGEITGRARLRHRQRPLDDSWIAACCLTYDLPLATMNVKDFADFGTHEGLTIITA